MANRQSTKGNPAGKRMSNEKRKAKRAAAWNRRQKEKEQTKKEVQKREAANRAAKKAGAQTPHEVKQHENLQKRNAVGAPPKEGNGRGDSSKSEQSEEVR